MNPPVIYCSHCGHKNDLGEHFCANCGVQLAASPLPPTPSSQPAPQPRYAMPAQPSQVSKSQKSGWRRWVIFGLVILGLLCCTIVFFFGKSIIGDLNLDRSTATPASDPSNTSVEMQELGNLNITTEGGTFKQDNLEISVPAGAVSNPVTLIINGEKTNPALPQGVDYQSRRYGFEGPFQQVTGDIEIKIKVPADALAGKQASDDETIMMEEPVYAPSAGFIMSQHPLATRIDAANSLMVAKIKVESPVVYQPGFFLASWSPNKTVNDQTTLTQKMIVWAKIYAAKDAAQASFSNQYFNLHTQGWIDNKSGSQILAILTEQKNLLESLNAQAFHARTSWPINVYLGKTSTYLGFSGMGNVDGLFRNSSLGINHTDILINYDNLVLKTPEGIRDLKATLGHELFHMVQSGYDPRSALMRTTIPDPVVWSDEAMSTWFESKAAGDDSFLPTNVGANCDSIRRPMFSASAAEMAEAKPNTGSPLESAIDPDKAKRLLVLTRRGYANSMFLRYLTKGFGDQLPVEMLEMENKQPNESGFSLISVWDKVLKLHETRLENEYPWFLETLIMNPKQGLGYNDNFTCPAMLTAPMLTAYVDIDTSSDQNNYITKFTTSSDLKPFTTVTPHALKSDGIPAKAQIKIPLNNFSAFPFQFYIKRDAMTENLKGKMKTVINISCTGNQGTQGSVDCKSILGMLLYYIPSGTTLGIISPTPVDYDKNGYFIPGSAMSSVTFSPSVFGPGTDYDGLIFIPFNNFATNSSEVSSIIIDIEMYYGENKPPEPVECSCLDTYYAGRNYVVDEYPTTSKDVISGPFTTRIYNNTTHCDAPTTVYEREDESSQNWKETTQHNTMDVKLCDAWMYCNNLDSPIGCPQH